MQMAAMIPDPFAATRSGALAPEDMLRRLRWRARRGLLENDLLLDRFFKQWEGLLTLEDHNGLGMLLNLTDNDLLDLLVGRQTPQGELDTPEVIAVLKKIQSNP
jgi:antitoxin CptB